MKLQALMLGLALGLTACASAEEKARARDSAMIAQAIADSVAEQEFVEDSVKLAASITADTITALRIVDQRVPDDPDTIESIHLAVARSGQVCQLTFEKYKTVAVGDTISCQWAPAP
jgi:hypothetical protein